MSLNLDEIGWTIAEGQTETYTFQVRFRRFDVSPPTDDYSQRLNIFWSMQETFNDGFPTENEIKNLHSFENRLIDAVELDEFAILSMVLTGNKEREFVFHTPDPQEFISRLSAMPQEIEPYPIEIQSSEDSTWEYYYSQISGIPGA